LQRQITSAMLKLIFPIFECPILPLLLLIAMAKGGVYK